MHINGIEEELAKIQVVNSVELQAEIWANILRLVYSAQANLGQLPLNGLNLSRIEHLLASIQDKTVDFTRRNIRNETQVEETTLTELYLQVKYVNSELQKQLAEKVRRLTGLIGRIFYKHPCCAHRILNQADGIL